MEGPLSEQRSVDWRDHLTIFLVSGAIMLYQLSLIRLLSVVVWYHFAFLAISLVMLGIGAPGVWFALARDPLRHLPWLLLASGLAVPLSVFAIVGYGAVLMEASAVLLVACILPATLSLGGTVCLMLMKARGAAIGRLYASDLAGAGLAAALVIPLMHVAPTPQLTAASGLLPLLCLPLQASRAFRITGLLALAIGVGLVVLGDPYRVTRSKSYDERAVRPIYERWSPTARITVFDEGFFFLEDHPSGFSWGRGTAYPEGATLRQYWLEQDGSAGSPITEFDGDLGRVEHLLYDVTTIGHQLRPPESVAIIGAGGGRDILSALLVGAGRIDAVELNRHTIEAVSERFGEFSGDPYHLDAVQAYPREGRSHLTHSDRHFDLIQVSLIDSWAASVAGAFALAENNLYTLEAFDLYLGRLGPRGILSISRWMSEVPRLIGLAHAALAQAGIGEPGAHIMVVGAGRVGTVLVSNTAFDTADRARVVEIASERGFIILHPLPPALAASRRRPPLIPLLASEGVAPLKDLGIDVAPPTDDRPYFFQMVSPFTDVEELGERALKMAGIGFNAASTSLLRDAMIGVTAIALALFCLPFALRIRGPAAAESLEHQLRGSLYFAAIGFGFMLIENMLVQRFVLYLGHPSYATTVIIAGLLIGMGIGSRFAEQVGVARLKRWGLGVPLALLLLVVGMPGLFTSTLGLPLAARITVSGALLLPLGCALGLFFPIGMLLFGDRSKPWYWALNGIFGVLASVMSLALSMAYGFTFVGLASAAGYAIAWACTWRSTPAGVGADFRPHSQRAVV